MASAGELDDAFAAERDSPALDYVMRYSVVEDDPDDPTTTAAAAAAGLLGPDLHGLLDPEPSDEHAHGSGAAAIAAAGLGRGAGRRGGRSLIDQLRQRALSGSSSDEEGQAGGEREWQSMDIPALLLSPHHAAALHSLSSSEDDTSAVPDFADQALAREADRAAQAAAEQLPPELRPLARAAQLLGFHRDQGHRRLGPGGGSGNGLAAAAAAADGSEPALHLMEANRFSRLCEPPLTAEQLEAVATTLLASAAAAAGAGAVTGASDCCSGGSSAAAAGDTPPPTAAGVTATRLTAAAAAAAAALAEEGVEWLDIARPDASLGATTADATTAPSAPAQEGTDVSVDQEERSVQLRRQPCKTATEAALDEPNRQRLTEEVARELAEAEAHVVAHPVAGGAVGAGSMVVTHGSVGHFVELKIAGAERAGGGVGAEGAEAVEGVAAAGGRAATDEAAASVAAEARRAVWGEGGWPYGTAMQSADLVEELKHSIQAQQEEAEIGAPGTLLP